MSGKARIYGGSPQFWLWTGVLFAVFIVIYWKFAEGKLESQKSAVMAKQRAVMQTLGVKILPFRERLERWVIELATDPLTPIMAGDLDLKTLENSPAVYLRIPLKSAHDATNVRLAAQKSLRDGFTSCLFVRRETTDGKPCRSPADCAGGLLCNDFGVCARPSQPYNLRLAYRTLRILSSDWTDDLHRASTDLKVRAFELDLDAVTQNDVPMAIEMLSHARYFAAVLDEEPPAGLPPSITPQKLPTERQETDEERLARAPHAARIGIWDLRTETPMVRMRAEASGEFVPVGSQRPVDDRVLAAEQRQVNSCALALEVRDALSGTRGQVPDALEKNKPHEPPGVGAGKGAATTPGK